MTVAITAFVALTLTLAASVLFYLANVRVVARHATGSRAARWGSALVAPASAWRLGERLLPLAFAGSALLYTALWFSLHTLGSS